MKRTLTKPPSAMVAAVATAHAELVAARLRTMVGGATRLLPSTALAKIAHRLYGPLPTPPQIGVEHIVAEARRRGVRPSVVAALAARRRAAEGGAA